MTNASKKKAGYVKVNTDCIVDSTKPANGDFRAAIIDGDCSLVRRFCSPKVRRSEIEGSSFRRFVGPKVRKSDDDFYTFLF